MGRRKKKMEKQQQTTTPLFLRDLNQYHHQLSNAYKCRFFAIHRISFSALWAQEASSKLERSRRPQTKSSKYHRQAQWLSTHHTNERQILNMRCVRSEGERGRDAQQQIGIIFLFEETASEMLFVIVLYILLKSKSRERDFFFCKSRSDVTNIFFSFRQLLLRGSELRIRHCVHTVRIGVRGRGGRRSNGVDSVRLSVLSLMTFKRRKCHIDEIDLRILKRKWNLNKNFGDARTKVL